jgi:Rogdi leucine zipper containing protein
LVLHLRTLEATSPNQASSAFGSEISSLTGFSLRDKIFGPRLPPHDELGEVFVWQGEEVRVKEKIRVESQDPSLIAVLAKLSALEHEVLKCRASLKIVMGEDDGDSDL